MKLLHNLMGSAALGYGLENSAPHAVLPTTGGPYNVNVSGSITANRGNPLADPSVYKVNVPATMEYIKQPLYSYQLYPTAGTPSLGFFQTQAGGAVTREFTNMELQGQLPSPQMFLIQGIGIDWLPGTTAGLPVLGPRADSNMGAANDMFTVFRAGVLTLTIGSKQYFQMAPLMQLPTRAHFDMAAAVATDLTAGAATQTIMQAPYANGAVFQTVPMLLESSQNFNVTISFPGGNIALPSGDALAKLGVNLYGTLYRPAQ